MDICQIIPGIQDFVKLAAQEGTLLCYIRGTCISTLLPLLRGSRVSELGSGEHYVPMMIKVLC